MPPARYGRSNRYYHGYAQFRQDGDGTHIGHSRTLSLPRVIACAQHGYNQLTADGGSDIQVQWPRNTPDGRFTAPDTIENSGLVTISITDTEKTHAGHVAAA